MGKSRVEAKVALEGDTTIFVTVPAWDGGTAVGVSLESMAAVNVWRGARLSVMANLETRSIAELVASFEGWQNLEPLPESLRVRRQQW